MVVKHIIPVVVLLIGLVLAACSPIVLPESETVPLYTVEDQATDSGEEETVADASKSDNAVVRAIDDLSIRLDVPAETIEVLEVRPVVWPDASIGCAEPGMNYAQTQQAGLLIRLSVGGDMVFYHSGADQEPFLCEATSQMVPKVTPKVDEFVPPPGSETD